MSCRVDILQGRVGKFTRPQREREKSKAIKSIASKVQNVDRLEEFLIDLRELRAPIYEMLRSTTKFGTVVLGALLVVAFVFAIRANLDLREGRPFLHMDEAISFDGVKKILSAKSPTTLLYAVTDGGDHRYGRIFFNASAVFAAVPYKIWGDPGLIVGVRIAQVFFLICAYMLCVRLVVKNPFGQALLFGVLFCLPFTSYYLSQPKPEPIQLLCVAVFITLARRYGYVFGWHWLFLGLAFGAKISAAPAVAACVAIGVFVEWRKRSTLPCAIRRASIGFGTFMLGWVAAVPILAVPTKQNIETYLSWTFRATGHGHDDSSVNALVWLREITGGEAIKHYVSPAFMVMVYLVLAMLLIGAAAHWTFRKKESLIFPAFLLLISASLFIPIILKVQRVWGFYLHPASVIGVCGFAGICTAIASFSQPLPPIAKWHRWFSVAACVLIGIAYPVISIGKAAQEYLQLAQRTQNPEFQKKARLYRSYVEVLERLASKTPGQSGETSPIRVAFDPYLYMPDSTNSYLIIPMWQPFNSWDANYDVVILDASNQWSYLSGARPLPPATSAVFEKWREAKNAFEQKVAHPGSSDDTTPFYELCEFGSSVYVFVSRSKFPLEHQKL